MNSLSVKKQSIYPFFRDKKQIIVLLKTSESCTLHNEIKHNDYIIKPKLTGNVCNTGKTWRLSYKPRWRFEHGCR